MKRLWIQLRLALADLRGDMRRFGLLLACLALGTGLVATVSSVSAILGRTLEREANVLLGADLEVARSGQNADSAERALFSSLGRVAEVIDTNSRASGDLETALIDLVAASSEYPLAGRVASPALAEGERLADLLDEREGQLGALLDPVLADRLGVAVGEEVEIGGTRFVLRGLLEALPDGPVRGVRLGLTALIPLEAYGTLFSRDPPLPGLVPQFRYKILLQDIGLAEAQAMLAALPSEAGWQVRTARDAIGPLISYYDFFTRYLLIVGLGAVLIGGAGVSQAVNAYMLERQRAVATFRALGATGGRLLVHYLSQILALALAGILAGMLGGGVLTLLLLPLLGRAVGIALPASVELVPLFAAGGIGLIVSLVFAYLPLVRAQSISPGVLFRSATAMLPAMPPTAWMRPGIVAPLLAGIAMLLVLMLGLTGDPGLTLGAGAAALVLLLVLQTAARLFVAVISALRPQGARLRGVLRVAGAAGSATPATITAIGMGLTLLLTLVLVVVSLRAELIDAVVADAPTLIATDLFLDEVEDIEALAEGELPIAWVAATPMLRGEVLRIGSHERGDVSAASAGLRFLFAGEIPIGVERELPTGSRLTAGSWWSADHEGPPLVSLHRDVGAELGVAVGDTVTLLLFGEEIEAEIGSFRDYRHQEGLNFAVAISPGLIEQYPLTHLGAIKAVAGEELALQRSLAERFADVSFVPVGDTLDQISAAMSQLAGVVLAAGTLALVNGLLVLVGATATGRKQREAEAVIVKVLGSTRGELLLREGLHIAALALYAALVAAALALALAALVVTFVLEIELRVDLVALGVVAVAAIALVVTVGLVNTSRILAISPARFLRQS